MSDGEQASAEAQLCRLYAERERLFDALGTADADEIIAMITSLQDQLAALEREGMRATFKRVR